MSTIFFSDTDSGHITYQIKVSEMYDRMQANILPLHLPSTPGCDLRSEHFFNSKNSQVSYQMNRNVDPAHALVIYTMEGGVMAVLLKPEGDLCIAKQYYMPLFVLILLLFLSLLLSLFL